LASKIVSQVEQVMVKIVESNIAQFLENFYFDIVSNIEQPRMLLKKN